MATIVIKSRLGGSIPFSQLEKANAGEVEMEESSTVFFLPRMVSNADGGAAGRIVAHLRAILEEEGIALDTERTHVFRIGIDPMTAISKLAELGFHPSSSCAEPPPVDDAAGGSIMVWTVVYNDDAGTDQPVAVSKKPAGPSQVAAGSSKRGRPGNTSLGTSDSVVAAGEEEEDEEDIADDEPNEEENASDEVVASDKEDRDYKAGSIPPAKKRGRPKKIRNPIGRPPQNGSNYKSNRNSAYKKQLLASATKLNTSSQKKLSATAQSTSQDTDSFGSQELSEDAVEDNRPTMNTMSEPDLQIQAGYVTTTNERLGTDDAERLLMGRSKVDPTKIPPLKPPGGSVWLYTDQGEPWRSRDYMGDGYRMQQCSTRMWPAQAPVVCVIQYRIIVQDKQSNEFCRYVMMLPSALHATAAECTAMRNGQKPPERQTFFYLIHYVGDHTVTHESANDAQRSRSMPSQVFAQHMMRGEKNKKPATQTTTTNNGSSSKSQQSLTSSGNNNNNSHATSNEVEFTANGSAGDGDDDDVQVGETN